MNFQDPRATQTPGQPQERKSALPGAELKKHGRFSPLWFIPIVAAGLVIYLTVRAIAKHGPTVTLTFKTAGGLVAQQTQVRYKDLTLGTVDDVELADDASHVIVKVKMDSDARPLLTDKARFWVVRPRFGSCRGARDPCIRRLHPNRPGGDSRKNEARVHRSRRAARRALRPKGARLRSYCVSTRIPLRRRSRVLSRHQRGRDAELRHRPG